MSDSVEQIIATILRTPASQINADSSMQNLEKWDSIQHLNIILAIEESFCIIFTAEQIPIATSVRKIKEMLRNHQSGKDVKGKGTAWEQIIQSSSQLPA